MSTTRDQPPGPTATVTLREITKETLHSILRLSVAEHQKHYVATNAVSIAQAYFEREKAWFRAIYADETPVGFLMLYDDPVAAEYFLWRFMIDARYQGYGYGKRALKLLIDHVRSRPGARELGVSCVPGEGSPCPFYEKMGFQYTGAEDEGELVMKLLL
ncbi:MAG: GNAT family N-acetyltransferase [Chloroflexi bacterium]|nr:MAG: GNAT family N-acetyltransferase [Chloroflexota bacterium]